ncbi:MAG: hypothetical protein Q8880_06385, partial [Bacteroidota bacterium]|nr:hypothetical protein [Bacteroidota bacterium]
KEREKRVDSLYKKIGIESGLIRDILISQEFCRTIQSEMKPLPEEKVKATLKRITTPFIANYIQIKNNALCYWICLYISRFRFL